MAIQSFILDPGAASPEDSASPIRSNGTTALALNDLVYISGWDETNARFLIDKADANVAGAQATLVMRAALAINTNGDAFRTFRTAADQNTTGVVGDPVYLSETAGAFTQTAPTAAGSIRQRVGRVAVVSGTVGVVEFDVLNQPVERIGSNELQDSAVATAKIASLAIDDGKIAAGAIKTKVEAETNANKLAAAALQTAAGVASGQLTTTAAKDNLDAMTDTARSYVKTNPVSGEFKVISVHRQADGKLDVEYDDVAV